MAVPKLITDEAEGKRVWNPTIRVKGRVTDFNVVKAAKQTEFGRNKGQTRAQVKFTIENVTELKREDGTEPDTQTFTLSYDYSEWKRELDPPYAAPERGGDWFQFVVPGWAEAGINLGDPDMLADKILDRIVAFEQKKFDRNYEVQARDPDTNAPITDDVGEKVMVTAEYANLFPVEIEGINFDPVEAYARAKELFEKHGAGPEFVGAAMDDALISETPKLKRAIQAGKYDPVKSKP